MFPKMPGGNFSLLPPKGRMLLDQVIVERATEARENDQDRKLKKKEHERSQNMINFALLCTWDA